MRVEAKSTVGHDPDVLAMDERLGVLYVASESGIVSLFDTLGSVTRIAQALLAPAAHTVSVDPETGLSYWPLQNVNARPVLRIMELRR